VGDKIDLLFSKSVTTKFIDIVSYQVEMKCKSWEETEWPASIKKSKTHTAFTTNTYNNSSAPCGKAGQRVKFLKILHIM
jgi:hypothetical protein